jgi:hypothetical protein
VKPTREYRTRMAIEFLFVGLTVILSGTLIVVADAWWVKGVCTSSFVIGLMQASDKWGLFWDGPDE